MNYRYINLDHSDSLIEGVVMHPLIIHRDQSGSLVETLRSDWDDVFSKKAPFKMQYVSQTPSGIARDEDKWHVHKEQKDRFICLSGRIVTAVFDPREKSATCGRLNLFAMGPQNENEMYMLVIPEETYHGFLVVSKTQGSLLNFPTQLYNPADEGRVHHKEELNWKAVREDFGL